MQTATIERRGRGRPPKGAPKKPKMETYRHTFTDEGHRLICELAEQLGMSPSAVIEYAAQRLRDSVANAA